MCVLSYKDPTFISKIIKDDESWIYSYEPETATIITLEEPTISKSKKGAAGWELNKERAHCFFAVKVIVHCGFVPSNIMVH
jgi:hypothetical protein